jgi:hypothetical protein
MALYESEITKFMREFLQKNPLVVEKQKKHRATWWDRPQSLEQTATNEASKVSKDAYEYYGKP